MLTMSLIILFAAMIYLVDIVLAMNHVPAQEWAEYKGKYNKFYSNFRTEGYAQYYYANNKRLIDRHNGQYAVGLNSYKLAINQFTDMRFVQFNTLFPPTTSAQTSSDSPLPAVQPAPPSYDPVNDFGFIYNIQNQGTKCNSGWAYATAKAIELFQAQQAGNMSPLPLSAQNLIDCAGRFEACTKQIPQTAFDYLARYNMDLLLESDYKNNNTFSTQGMCTPKGDLVTNLGAYGRLKDGDDESLKAYVSNGFPVVVEFDPSSFEFMHYSEGIFQQPVTRKGSHYMVVIGYSMDPSTGMDYWLLQNSFGTTWGEMGLMKFYRNPTKNVTKNAIFPTELA